MKNHSHQLRTTGSIAFALCVSTLFAREYQGGGVGGGSSTHAAGCAPSTSVTRLWVNNVRTLVETGGIMWENRSTGDGYYEVPAPKGTPLDVQLPSSLFAGALWMGGFDQGNNLKMAAVRFRQDGNDFWPGPLTTDGSASVTADVCQLWDRTWSAGKQDALDQQAYFTCLPDPACSVDDLFPDGYVVPDYFQAWPAIGDVANGQDQYLAPFTDFDGDGDYDPSQGDAPDYGLNEGNLDCKNKFRTSPVTLFGDSTIWWIFNDKGNVHTESGGQQIGMEVRAQAFAFATNDEVNNMTFYNYVLINQGSQTLAQTYFAQYVDADLGCSGDDYVGCDVERGLGFAYNGNNNDAGSACAGGAIGYGVQPPAIGVDFFEGPFVDYDSLDNPLTLNCDSARNLNGIPYKGIGIGYGDGVVDNERYGMRVFMYYNNNDPGPTSDPSYPNALDHYNYMRAIWKDNSHLLYGGRGHAPNDDPDQDLDCQYMCPWDSDPVGWGTQCIPQYDWREENNVPPNPAGDRRFVQSAGPFTLEPGAYNNITVGVVWARASSGGPSESVTLVKAADAKAQSLFDNCFKILNGPDAPIVDIIELDRQLVLTISNPTGNNRDEGYHELDPTIPEDAVDREYRFQGYEVYQLKDATVSIADIRDQYGHINELVAHRIALVDKKDGVTQLNNYLFDQAMGLPVPAEMVNGPDKGIQHSFSVTEDKFSQGNDQRLVNFKTYYFMVLAYAYNNWEDYNSSAFTGQAFPYKAGRKAASGSIRAYSGIPHKNTPEDFGTTLQTGYGDGFQIVRLEGIGNGGLEVDLEQSTVDAIVNGPEYRKDVLRYKEGFGPVNVKVVDPLHVPLGTFELWIQDTTDIPDYRPTTYAELNDAYWWMTNVGSGDTVFSDQSISIHNEQLVLKWGMSVQVEQMPYENQGGSDYFTPYINATIEYENNNAWFYGVPDEDGENLFNWIRSGTANQDNERFADRPDLDNEEVYEKILDGTWAPWPLCGDTAFQPVGSASKSGRDVAHISECPSVLIQITDDKSKWTRCGVIEMEMIPTNTESGSDVKGKLRSDASLDKNGIPSGTGGCNEAEASLNGAEPEGMSWFPGYAIDLESGERLNMAFGENSLWGGAAGSDMVWNPTTQLVSPDGTMLGAGSHFIFVFKNNYRAKGQNSQMPQYDNGVFMYDNLNGNNSAIQKVWASCAWVGSSFLTGSSPMKSMALGLVPGDVRIRINVSKPYTMYDGPDDTYTPLIPEFGNTYLNQGLPRYTFSTGNQATITNQIEVAKTACDMIDIVPNPYYSFSGYETGRLDNRVKFINLPRICTISIYNVSGTLVRKFRKDNELTYLDWDLKNQVNVPIAGGVYICHIDVPGVCERVVKWFGVIRPVDLQNF